MNKHGTRSAVWFGSTGSLLLGAGMLAGCGNAGGGGGDEKVGVGTEALGSPGGAQACVVGTNSLRIAQRVTTSGGLAANSLSLESGTVANGGANINNVGGATVRISGATINGTVSIAGPAPSQANGQLINGGVINGAVITGAGLQAALPVHDVTPGTTSITQNSGSPPQAIAPGSYAAININGSSTVFSAGTYDLASLTINSGAQVTFDTSGGPVVVNTQGSITVNGGILSATDPSRLTFYSNSSASNAVVINAGVTSVPGTITAPNGGVSIGSRVNLNGCVGGKDVNIEPDSRVNSIETLTVETFAVDVPPAVTSQFSYPIGTDVRITVSGQIVWGGCDPVNCPNGSSCNFTRLGDAQFHSDNCFTPPDPTFSVFGFPIQLFLDGAPLPSTAFAADHVYSFIVPGTGGPFVFRYNDLPGTYGDNSGTLSVTIAAL